MDELSAVDTSKNLAGSGNRTLLYVIGALVIVILVLAATLFFVRIQGDRLSTRITAVIRLHGVEVISLTDAQPQLYSLGIFGLNAIHLSGISGEIVEYAEGGTTKAAIREDADKGINDIVLLANKKQIGTSESHKAALEVSPSGTFIAYSTATSTETRRLSVWNMHLYNTKDSRDVELGIGYGAQFVTHEGKEFLIYTTPTGIQYVALDTMDGFLTPFDIKDDTFYSVKASPDGRYIATRDAALREWSIVSITKLEIGFPIRMTPLRTNLSTLTSVTFTDNSLIGIEPVWKDETRTESNYERIHALPLSAIETASTKVVYTIPTTSLFVFSHL